MAINKIKFKRTNVAGRLPVAADVDVGEILINMTDKKIYTKNDSGAIINIGGAGEDFIRKVYEETNVKGKTVFPAQYDVGFLDIEYNGIGLASVDFTATDGVSVTLHEPVAQNTDIIKITAFRSGDISEVNGTNIIFSPADGPDSVKHVVDLKADKSWVQDELSKKATIDSLNLKVSKTGDTMTGTLTVPTIISPTINISGGRLISYTSDKILRIGNSADLETHTRVHGTGLGDVNKILSAWVEGTDKFVYHQGFKPTPTDIGALPSSGVAYFGGSEFRISPSAQINFVGKGYWLSYDDSAVIFKYGNLNWTQGHTIQLKAGYESEFKVNKYKVYHEGFKPTTANIGALPGEIIAETTLSNDGKLGAKIGWLNGKVTDGGTITSYTGNWMSIVGATGHTSQILIGVNDFQFRTQWGDTVSAWSKLYHSNNKPTAADVGALTQSQGDARYVQSGGGGAIDKAKAVVSLDTRSTNPLPLAVQDFPGTRFDFKANSADGFSQDGLYHGVMSFRPYGSGADDSGGGTHQLAFGQNGRVGVRYGNSTWGNWDYLYSTTHKPTPAEVGAVNKAGDTMTGKLNVYLSSNTATFGHSGGGSPSAGVTSDIDHFIEVKTSGITASSGVVFHNSGYSTAALRYKNLDENQSYFEFKTDDSSFRGLCIQGGRARYAASNVEWVDSATSCASGMVYKGTDSMTPIVAFGSHWNGSGASGSITNAFVVGTGSAWYNGDLLKLSKEGNLRVKGGMDSSWMGSINPSNGTASATLQFTNNIPCIRYGGAGAGSGSGFRILGTGDSIKMNMDNNGNVQFSGQVVGTATATTYGGASFEAVGNGSTNTIKPSISFHQPGVFASQLTGVGDGMFQFTKGDLSGVPVKITSAASSAEIRFGASSYISKSGTGLYVAANETGGTVYIEGKNNPVARIGTSNYNIFREGGSYSTLTLSNWIRTSGNTGWYSATHGGGIYMQDSTWVRTYAAKKFHVDNADIDAIYTTGGIRADKGLSHIEKYGSSGPNGFGQNIKLVGDSSSIQGEKTAIGFHNNGNIYFTTGGTNYSGGGYRMNLNNDGLNIIGSMTAASATVTGTMSANKISMYNTPSDYAYIQTTKSGTSTHFDFVSGDDAGGNDSIRWIHHGYEVGNTYRVLGAIYQEGNSATGSRMNIYGQIVASTNITAYSDERIKTDIKIIDNALDKVSQIRGITYVRTDTGDDTRKCGVIAQELEKVLPEAVITSKNEDAGIDDFKSVDYGNISALLIEAIKELSAKVDILSSQNEYLLKEVANGK